LNAARHPAAVKMPLSHFSLASIAIYSYNPIIAAVRTEFCLTVPFSGLLSAHV